MKDFRAVIIDDEAWTRDTIKRIGRWEEYGFSIVGEASDGRSGLQCIKDLQPHLIITDMKMPGLDGVHMLKEMERLDLAAKVIIVSGYTDYAYTRQALASRAVDYLLKPIDEAELNTLLEQCSRQLREVENHEALSPFTSILEGVDSIWLEAYRDAREAIRRSLEISSEYDMRQAFKHLRQLYHERESELHLQLLIRINQDIHAIIEEELISLGPGISGSFPAARLSFTIGEEKSIEDLCAHYGEIIEEIIALNVAEHQRGQRADLRPVRKYIDTHYRENLTLEFLADQFALSKEYLSTRFKKDFGITFSEYLLNLRMKKAKELITEYRIPLSKVPEMTGYIDTPHFYKVFKRYYHMTPGEMREFREKRLSTDNGEA